MIKGVSLFVSESGFPQVRAFAGWPGTSSTFLLQGLSGESSTLDLKIVRTCVAAPEEAPTGAPATWHEDLSPPPLSLSLSLERTIERARERERERGEGGEKVRRRIVLC
jgi:hypothetical protein